MSQVLLNSIEVVIGLPAQKQNRQPLPQEGKNSDRSQTDASRFGFVLRIPGYISFEAFTH